MSVYSTHMQTIVALRCFRGPCDSYKPRVLCVGRARRNRRVSCDNGGRRRVIVVVLVSAAYRRAGEVAWLASAPLRTCISWRNVRKCNLLLLTAKTGNGCSAYVVHRGLLKAKRLACELGNALFTGTASNIIIMSVVNLDAGFIELANYY